MDEGNLLRLWGIGGGFIYQATHGEITWGNPITNMRSRRGQGRTYHIYGLLPPDYEVGRVPSAGMSCNFPHHRLDERIFHVHKFVSKVAVLQEGRDPLTCCTMCGMHMPARWILKH